MCQNRPRENITRYAKRIKITDTTGLEISLREGNEQSLQQLWHCRNNGNEFSFPLTQPAFTCSKLTIARLEQAAFIINVEHISQHILVFLLLTLNM